MLVSLPQLHFHTTSSYYRRGPILETYTKRIFNCLFHVMLYTRNSSEIVEVEM